MYCDLYPARVIKLRGQCSLIPRDWLNRKMRLRLEHQGRSQPRMCELVFTVLSTHSSRAR
jgi:hypothetical protein